MTPVAAAVIDSVERSDSLRRLGDTLRGPVAAAFEGKRLRDALSGSWLGHPAHPAVVSLPLGMWSAALLADLKGEPATAQRYAAVGLVGALPAAATGLSDWLDTAGAEQRVGLVHLGVNLVASALVSAGWAARRSGRYGRGAALGAAGLMTAGVGGWLGGHLAYSLGVGVDTNAFDGGPEEWTDLAIEDSAERTPGIQLAQADGITLAVIELEGRAQEVAVLANRCSHRGGPLADGGIEGRCIRCPWHNSQFDIETGAVVRGPATTAQPVYEARQGGSGWQVRRRERRALRANSVRAHAK